MACKHPHPVGESCHCNQNGNCLTSFQIKSDAGLFEFKNGDIGSRIIKLVDKGDGAKVNIAVEGHCNHHLASCPSGYVTDQVNYSEALSISEPKNYVLSYRLKPGNALDLFGAIKIILAEYNVALDCTRYWVCITQCAGKPQVEQVHWMNRPISYWLGLIPTITLIEVYPKTVIEPSLTFNLLPSKTRHLSKPEKREERKIQYSYGNRKPIPNNEIEDDLRLSGSFSITQGHNKTEYTSSTDYTRNNLTKVKKLKDATKLLRAQWKVFDALLDMTETIRKGTYRSAGKNEIKIINCDFGETKIKLEGSMTHDVVNSTVCRSGKITLGFEPLLEFKMTLDLVLAVATYYKMEQVIAEVREQALILEEKVKAGEEGAYVGAEFYIELSSALSANGSISFNPDQTVSYNLDTKTPVKLAMVGNVRGGAKVWIFEGIFNLRGEIAAKATLALKTKIQQGKPRVDLVFFHDGIEVEIKIDVSASIKIKKEKSTQGNTGRRGVRGGTSTTESSTKKIHTKKWKWSEAIDEDSSPYRIALIGG